MLPVTQIELSAMHPNMKNSPNRNNSRFTISMEASPFLMRNSSTISRGVQRGFIRAGHHTRRVSEVRTKTLQSLSVPVIKYMYKLITPLRMFRMKIHC